MLILFQNLIPNKIINKIQVSYFVNKQIISFLFVLILQIFYFSINIKGFKNTPLKYYSNNKFIIVF
jgi:hypothetical protein